jgi:hypothetical protein
MMTKRFGVLLASLLCAGAVHAAPADVQESTVTLEIPETDQTTSTQESEAKEEGIIPKGSGGLHGTPAVPLTPTSVFEQKKPYEQAQEELLKALEYWNAGHAEAASDKALEAYDDFIELRRVPGVKRSKIRAQAHQAATIYVEAGIKYIKEFVRRTGSNQAGIEEGRARMEDLRDVARGYPELNKMLNNAINDLSSPPVETTPKK